MSVSRRTFVHSLCFTLLPALGACSKSSTPEQSTNVATGSAAAAPASASAAPAKGPLKVAFAYVGPVGDAGWTFAHDRARKEVQAAFGDKIATSFVENVPEAADAERVIRDMIDQGNTLIFGTTFGYMEPMLRLAADAKNVKFEHATGYKTAPNLRTYDSRTYEGAYLAGVVAGAVTKTGTLGVVASIPIPEVIRNIDSFTLGAQSMNPKVVTKVVWVNKWFDPPKETEAAQALLNQGADILMQNTDSSAVLKTAEKAGKHGFGWDSDMSRYGPKAHLASAVINWTPYYKKAIETRSKAAGRAARPGGESKKAPSTSSASRTASPPRPRPKSTSSRPGSRRARSRFGKGPSAIRAAKRSSRRASWPTTASSPVSTFT